MKRIFVFLPPLRSVSGGLAVLADTAAGLAALGRDVVLVLREPGTTPLSLPAGLPVVPLAAAGMTPDDVYLVPEGWPNALAPGFAAGARCVVYCQNWAYLFNGLPEGVGWDRLPVSFVAVSDPVARHIELALGTLPPVLRPGIDPARFHPPASKPAPDPVRVGFMPRKNKALATMIRNVVAARAPRTGLALEWVAIDGLPPDGVAEALRPCHVFLATGFPEGCPLPPLEAMACGCVVAGFAGFGGFDYMRQAGDGGYVPSVPLRGVPWGGNGFYAADNDVFGATACLEAAARLWLEGGEALEGVLANSKRTAVAYGPGQRLQCLKDFF
ncbi:glycosyltransferase family 4 protein [Solidesulfovibrio alcoholivorans]|uniref:glycosyltransferase family 4 protein n=1 Tax=Solidesulfovibrio alcoholivorans TaxID=81406 RepID=UPI000495B6AF|nr:glycosyltransferase family 4 protein [Solidesulfovibrio alcoholivorans]